MIMARDENSCKTNIGLWPRYIGMLLAARQDSESDAVARRSRCVLSTVASSNGVGNS